MFDAIANIFGTQGLKKELKWASHGWAGINRSSEVLTDWMGSLEDTDTVHRRSFGGVAIVTNSTLLAFDACGIVITSLEFATKEIVINT